MSKVKKSDVIIVIFLVAILLFMYSKYDITFVEKKTHKPLNTDLIFSFTKSFMRWMISSGIETIASVASVVYVYLVYRFFKLDKQKEKNEKVSDIKSKWFKEVIFESYVKEIENICNNAKMDISVKSNEIEDLIDDFNKNKSQTIFNLSELLDFFAPEFNIVLTDLLNNFQDKYTTKAADIMTKLDENEGETNNEIDECILRLNNDISLFRRTVHEKLYNYQLSLVSY